MENNNLNIEQTLNEVKEGIINNTMTKEQAELLIKKCDILIKKNKRNQEMAQNNAVEKVTTGPKESSQEDNAEEECYAPFNEELIDTLFVREEREGCGVRYTVECWFSVDLKEWEDGVYMQSDFGEYIYFFDEKDMLVGVAEFRNWTGNCEKLEENLDKLYQARDGYWYDRRTDCKIKICQTRRGTWFVVASVDDYDRYRNAIRDFENSLM